MSANQVGAVPSEDAFEKAWREYNANGNAGGWERVAFISGFGKGFKAGMVASPASSATMEQDANKVELAKRVLLQHLNGEDYDMSLAALYAILTEDEPFEAGAASGAGREGEKHV